MTIKAVVFDFDGTLASEREYILGCFRHVSPFLLEVYGIKDAYTKLKVLFEEEWNDTFGRLFKAEGISYTQEDIKILVSKYREAPPAVKLYEDTLKTLQYLKKKNIKTAILTNGYFNVQRKKIEISGLSDLVLFVEIPDKYGREFWKPDTRRLEQLLLDMGVLPEESVYVGDSNSDYLVAEKMGMKFYYVERSDRVTSFDYNNVVANKGDSLTGIMEVIDR